MNLETWFLNPQTKKSAEKIVRYVGTDKARLRDLMRCYFSDETPIAQRASMVAGYIAMKDPKLLLPYLPKVLKRMGDPVHDAVIRNGLRILDHVDIPAKLNSAVINRCFELLNRNSSSFAIKVYSIAVLIKFCEKYPDLKNELKVSAAAQIPYQSHVYENYLRKLDLH